MLGAEKHPVGLFKSPVLDFGDFGPRSTVDLELNQFPKAKSSPTHQPPVKKTSKRTSTSTLLFSENEQLAPFLL